VRLCWFVFVQESSVTEWVLIQGWERKVSLRRLGEIVAGFDASFQRHGFDELHVCVGEHVVRAAAVAVGLNVCGDRAPAVGPVPRMGVVLRDPGAGPIVSLDDEDRF
jgi:hypothetical protein